MKNVLTHFIADTQGQDLVEYSLLLVFLTLISAAIASGFHGSIAGVTSTTEANLSAGNAFVR